MGSVPVKYLGESADTPLPSNTPETAYPAIPTTTVVVVNAHAINELQYTSRQLPNNKTLVIIKGA